MPGCKAKGAQGRHFCHKSSYLSHCRDHTAKGFLLTLSKWEKQARSASLLDRLGIHICGGSSKKHQFSKHLCMWLGQGNILLNINVDNSEMSLDPGFVYSIVMFVS